MRRTALSLFAVLVIFACSPKAHDEHADHQPAAAPASAPEKMSTATNTKFGDASGYLAAPGTPGKKGAILLIHEWWGLDDWIRHQTDRFAQQGYVALAVDLYRGRVTNNPDEAHELMRGLPDDRALADMKAAVDYLASRPDVDPKHIGVIGWCMGGGKALSLTVNEPRLVASAINYGALVTDPGAITKINAKILGNFGEADRGIPAEDVKKFGAELTKYGKLGDIKIYPGAGHAFMRSGEQPAAEPANREAQSAAWRRWLELLRRL